MHHPKTATGLHRRDNQTAKSPLPTTQLTQTPSECAASPLDGLARSETASHVAADERLWRAAERARAQATNTRVARIRAHQSAQFESYVFVEQQLARRIARLFSFAFQSNPTTRDRFFYPMLDRAARIALRQAHRAARRHGLKRIAGIDDWLDQHCAWFVRLCRWVQRCFYRSTTRHL